MEMFYGNLAGLLLTYLERTEQQVFLPKGIVEGITY
jgi:hypothetical protein